jgi:hypothetical protein
MRCSRCGTENTLGATFCRQCGQKLEMSDAQAHAQALASVSHDNWHRAFLALGRTLYFFFLVFVGALMFRSCARREIMADYSAAAPLPPVASVDLAPVMFHQPTLPIPQVRASGTLAVERNDVAALTAEMAQTVRDRLTCSVMLEKTGIIRGVLLSRTDDEIQVITSWEPYTVRTIKTADINFEQSKLP